jgi:hypothetical protein
MTLTSLLCICAIHEDEVRTETTLALDISTSAVKQLSCLHERIVPFFPTMKPAETNSDRLSGILSTLDTLFGRSNYVKADKLKIRERHVRSKY